MEGLKGSAGQWTPCSTAQHPLQPAWSLKCSTATSIQRGLQHRTADSTALPIRVANGQPMLSLLHVSTVMLRGLRLQNEPVAYNNPPSTRPWF